MPISLNRIEEEVIFLRAIKEQIDSMVNFELLRVHGNDPNSEIRFKTMTHQRFFNIILVDFLSCTAPKAPVTRASYLGALKSICEAPNFNIDGSDKSLRDSTTAFRNWLDKEVDVDVWFPSISLNAKLQVKRFDYLKMCGNKSKHNFLRAVGVAEKLQEIIAKSLSSPIDLDDALLALGDFYDRFHSDILNYQASTIAEFLNNIRWGIYDYLQPEFRRSIIRDLTDASGYRFTYPINVTSKFAKACYWDLMNEVRNPPYVRRFQVPEYLKMAY